MIRIKGKVEARVAETTKRSACLGAIHVSFNLSGSIPINQRVDVLTAIGMEPIRENADAMVKGRLRAFEREFASGGKISSQTRAVFKKNYYPSFELLSAFHHYFSIEDSLGMAVGGALVEWLESSSSTIDRIFNLTTELWRGVHLTHITIM